jgi:hypothetical protein
MAAAVVAEAAAVEAALLDHTVLLARPLAVPAKMVQQRLGPSTALGQAHTQCRLRFQPVGSVELT